MKSWLNFLQCMVLLCTLIVALAIADTLELPALTVQAPITAAESEGGLEISVDQSVIASQGAMSVSDALAHHPMVQLQSHSSSSAQNAIALHGFGDNASVNSLYMLDDTPFMSASLVGPDLNTLLPGAISDYTILPGSYGVLYGNQAIGGVVKLSTTIPSKPMADLAFSLGNNYQYGVSFIGSEQDDNGMGFRLGGSVYNNDHDQPHHRQQDYLMNLQWSDQSDDRSSGIRFVAYNTTIEIPASYLWGSSAEPASSTTVNTTQGYMLQGNHQRQLTDNWQWLTHLLWFDDHQTSTSLSSVSDQSSLLWKNDGVYGTRWKLGWDVNYDTYQTDNSKASYDSDEYLTSAYARYTQPLQSSLSLAVGARGAWQGIGATSSAGDSCYQHNTAVVNEESLYWKPYSHWRFFLRRDMNFRMPKGKEEVWSGDGTVHELSVQTGTAYETGFNWKQSSNAFHVGLFHLDIDNELSYTLFPLPYGEVTNLPPTRRVGVDLSTQHTWSQQWSSSYEMTWVNPTMRSGLYEGNQIPGVSAFNGGVGITYDALRQWGVVLMESYHSGFYASDDFDNTGDKMPGYWLTNARLQKQWGKMTAMLRADNIFDEHSVRYAQYYSDGTIRYYSADGFTLLVTLKINLEQ